MLIIVDTHADRFSREVAAMLEMAVFTSGETRTGDAGIDAAEDALFKAAVSVSRAWRVHDLNGVVVAGASLAEAHADYKAEFIEAVKEWTGFLAGALLDASVMILNFSKPDGAPDIDENSIRKLDKNDGLFKRGTTEVSRMADGHKTFDELFESV